MDWKGIGLGVEASAWLEAVARARYVGSQKLDPFATSMRDFDDVSPNLESLKAGSPPVVTDSTQRLGDLRAAGLASAEGLALSPLGSAVLEGWQKLGVGTTEIDDELGRLLIFVLEGRRIGGPDIAGYIRYWGDIRSHFDPYATIENWDALYALNFMDFARSGFAPGRAFREQKTPIETIEFDLADFARSTGASQLAVEGGARVERAIRDQIPRGRHRATFCMALEIEAGGPAAASVILNRFGTPLRPRSWKPFSEDQKAKVTSIVGAYSLSSGPAARPAAYATGADRKSGGAKTARTREPLALPDNIDFSRALVARPSAAPERAGMVRSSTPRKRDYVQQAQDDSEVGNLGEMFALGFERWRLRDRPDLVARIRHVADEDDTLGYDIESFELDGTERYVEVKTTTSALESRFFISANELETAAILAEKYVILRIAQLTTSPICCEYRYPFDGVLDLMPSTYVAVPAAKTVAAG